MNLAADGAWLGELARIASARSGCAADAILPDAIQRAADDLCAAGIPRDEIVVRARSGDPRVVDRLLRAAAVAESFFFREPAALRAAVALLAPSAPVRAWCAGCARGEEAWSLAAILRAAGPGRAIEVLGTDLIAGNVEAARAGVYRPWSARSFDPLERGALVRGDTSITIAPPLRELVRFEQHNLLDQPPPGPFELVVCRNVLLYFHAQAARRAVRHLTAAVAPGGVLVLGTLELDRPPDGFARLGAAELQVFRRSAGDGP